MHDDLPRYRPVTASEVVSAIPGDYVVPDGVPFPRMVETLIHPAFMPEGLPTYGVGDLQISESSFEVGDPKKFRIAPIH